MCFLFNIAPSAVVHGSLACQNRTRRIKQGLALAALAACLVKALGERDPAFQAKFEANLEKTYNNIREMETRHIGAVEILHWTREFLKEL